MIDGEARTDDTEGSLLRMRELLESSGTVPFSSSPRVNRDDLLTLIDEALEHLPEELKRARWLLKERNEFLAKAEREAEQIIEAARVQAERMVERDEVVRAARRHADALVEDAESRSRVAARGRGLRRPAARRVRGRARPHDADGATRSRAAPGAHGLAGARRRRAGRRRRTRLLRPGRLGSRPTRPGCRTG